VPAGTVAAYSIVDPWKYFNIVGDAGGSAASLTLSPTTLDFTAAGGTKPVTVTSNVSWTASKNASWITISSASGSNNGSIDVTVAAGTSTSPQTGTVTVTGGGITRTVSVTQAAYGPPAIKVTDSPTTLEFTQAG
jgi:hypothetical protein